MATISKALAHAIAANRAGRLDQAEQVCRQILQADPRNVQALHLMATVSFRLGRHAATVEYLGRAIAVQPRVVAFHNNLSMAYRALNKFDEAIACCQRALELDPRCIEAHRNMADALREQKKPGEAVAWYRRTLALVPEDADVHTALGVALQDQGQVDEAAACYRQAITLKPDHAQAHVNLGLTLQEQRKFDEAAACFRRALEVQPDLADAHLALSAIQLLQGDFEHGWPEYEWRWPAKRVTARHFRQPRWDGRPLAGATILVHVEQGLGDTIQFIRYAPLLKRQGGRVIVACQKAMLPLLATCPGIDQFIAEGDNLPAFDFHVPLLSLPGILGTSLTNLPADIPYLFAAPALVEQWRERIRTLPGRKVGICWQGSSQYAADAFRSIPPRSIAPLAQVPGVSLISLQKGATPAQLAEIGGGFPVLDLAGELDEKSGAFMDTAAVIANLDLVVTCDTAVGHLAGALGAPVWVALSFVSDWRWFLDRDDSPWYPTVRLFRQQQRGDWADTFQRIQAALVERVQCS